MESDIPRDEKQILSESIIHNEEFDSQIFVEPFEKDQKEEIISKSFLIEKNWTIFFFIVAILLLTAIPSILIVLDRWFLVPDVQNYSRNYLCEIKLFCLDGLPGYFLYVPIFLLISGTVIFMYGDFFNPFLLTLFHSGEIKENSNKIKVSRLFILAFIFLVFEIIINAKIIRIPGAELLLIIILFYLSFLPNKYIFFLERCRKIKNFLKTSYYFLTLNLISVIVLIILIKEYYQSFGHINWIYIGLFFLVTVLVIKNMKRFKPIYWITVAIILIFSLQLEHWLYVIIGDEFPFYLFVKDLSTKSFFWKFSHLFDLKGVYETHSLISSLITNNFMKIFGFDHFGWIFSNCFIVILSVIMFYYFFKMFLDQKVALLSVLFLAFSAYLIGFSKIGYNNLQALMFGAIAFLVTGYAMKNKSISNSFLVGIVTGGLLYTFQAAYFYIPSIIIFLLIYDPPKSKKAIIRYLITLFGFVILLIPILFQPNIIDILLQGTFYNNLYLIETSNTLKYHLWSNFIYSLFSYLYLFRESHYVVSSMIDPISGILFFVGSVILIRFLPKNKFFLFLIIAYLFETLTVGMIHDYPAPSITRMFVVLPWIYCISAIGLTLLLKLIASTTPYPGKTKIYGERFMVVLILFLNLVQSQYILHNRYPVYNFEPVVFRVMQYQTKISNNNLDNSEKYLFLTKSENDLFWMKMLQDVYKIPDSKVQLDSLDLETQEMTSDWINQINNDENIIIFAPTYLTEDILEQISTVMEDNNKSSCKLKYRRDAPVMALMWFSPKYQYICDDLFSY